MASETRPIQTVFSRLAAEGAGVDRIAAEALASWGRVQSALAPVVGERGVAALYKRSAYLARLDYPWLLVVGENADLLDEFATLHTTLRGRSSADAAAANIALLEAFSSLLSNLIGESLTERLLERAADSSSSNNAVQDPSR